MKKRTTLSQMVSETMRKKSFSSYYSLRLKAKLV